MGKTITEKILSEHAGSDARAGSIVISKVDFAFAPNTTGQLSIKQLKAAGFNKLANPARTAFYMDHGTPSPNPNMSNDQIVVRNFAFENGTLFTEVGEGVCHQLVAESMARPGDVITGADSHSTTAGALGAFATGMGSTDIAIVFALGKTWLRVPEIFKIVVSGKLPDGVYSKDIALRLIGMLGAEGASYRALEFCGDTVDNMSMPQRLTMANMSIEAGAKAGIFATDEITRKFLIGQGRGEDYRPIAPDADAVYERIIEIDVSGLEPMVAKPHTVDNVAPVSELRGTRIDQVSIGTCTNGRLEDLAIVAGILKGKRHHLRTRVIVAPASRSVLLDAIKAGYIQTIIEAGGAVVSPGCASCSGNHEGLLGDGESCFSTANRNFKGRMGSPEAFVYLGNPAMAAATAIAGEITDPREVM